MTPPMVRRTSDSPKTSTGANLAFEVDRLDQMIAVRGDMDHRLFVSRYPVALPKPEQLIEPSRAAWEQRHPGPASIEDQP